MVQISLDLKDDIYNDLRRYAGNADVGVDELVNIILSFVTTTFEHYRFFKRMLEKRVED